ncbi:MAG: hypothetical protein WC066_04905 [Candidatus Omnitrophota bacterium]|jgi:hypothetical protein
MLLNKRALLPVFIFFLAAGFVFAGEEFSYQDKGKRNPFIPLVTPEGRLLKLDKPENAGKEGLVIEGIIYDKAGRSFAIVNSSVVGVGDTVADFQVLKILEGKVVFARNGELLEVELTKEGIE